MDYRFDTEAEIRADERRKVEAEILEHARLSYGSTTNLLRDIRTGAYYLYRAGPLPGSPTDKDKD